MVKLNKKNIKNLLTNRIKRDIIIIEKGKGSVSMRDYTDFVRMAKESKNLDELKAKVLKSGSGAYFNESGELMTGAKDYFGFVTFSAEMTENGIKCTMY
jgi:hypothetical protein